MEGDCVGDFGIYDDVVKEDFMTDEEIVMVGREAVEKINKRMEEENAELKRKIDLYKVLMRREGVSIPRLL